MALKQIQVYVMLGIALLVSSSLLTEKAHARVQALSFISEHEGTADLYLIDSTGQNLRKLVTNNAKKGSEHAWSPDGQWIAYAFQRIVRLPGPGERLPVDEVFGDSAIHLVKATSGFNDPIEVANELSLGLYLEWVPEAFLPVSPSTEKQIVPWADSSSIDDIAGLFIVKPTINWTL